MRRKDREVTDAGKIREAIEASHCCRLGFYDEGEVYIVPMNFGYTEEEEKRIFYFHSAKEGRKVFEKLKCTECHILPALNWTPITICMKGKKPANILPVFSA